MRLLIWQSTRPVLWANLVAWPAAALILQHWLTGFGYHVPLNPLWFAAATSISLAPALITVSAPLLSRGARKARKSRALRATCTGPGPRPGRWHGP